MAINQWNGYLLEQVRQLPMASSKQQVQFQLNTIEVEASKLNRLIPQEFELIFTAYMQARTGKLIAAISTFFDAISLAQQTNQEFLICFCHYNIGTLYGMLGNYFYANKFLTKAEKSQQFCDHYICAIIKNNIGDIFRQLGNFTEALTYLSSAAETLKQYGPQGSAALPLFNIAEIKAKQFHFSEAEIILSSLYPVIKNEARYLGFYYKINAEIAGSQEDCDKAEEYHLLSIENMKASNNDYYLSEMILEYCHFLTSNNKFDALDDYIQQGLVIAKSLESDKLIDGFNDIILLRIQDIKDITIREEHYKTLTSSLLNSRRELLKRENEYLQQLYRLNTTKLELSTMKALSDNLAVINKIGQYISTSTDIQSILPKIQHDLSSLFQTDTLALGFYEQHRNEIVIHYLDDSTIVDAPYVTHCDKEATYMSYCISTATPFYFNHMTCEEKIALLGDSCNKKVNFHSAMFAPIFINNEVNAVFTIQAKESYQYQAFHFELFSQLISYISISLENQQNRQQLLALSQTDHLTQVWNRKSLDIHFHQLKSQKIKYFTGVMIDIDHYKEYNDTYGHVAGDEVLIQVSNIIKKYFYSLTTNVYRYGGDEFFALLEGIDQEKTQHKLSCMLEELTSLQIPHKNSTCSTYVSASVGIAYLSDNEKNITLNQLIDESDKALYHAKRNGRNQFCERSQFTKLNAETLRH